MSDNRVSFTSLCYITKDHEGRIWLSRLADVEDGILHTPFKSERTDNYFENRDELYRRDGPTAIGTIGVWEWTAIPNRNNPATDYVESYYVKDYAPVRVVVLGAKSLNEVVEQLQNGTAHTQDYLCDTFFCYEPRWEQLIGVLCRSSEFKISDQYAKLSETIYSLPSYTISSEDIYNWEDCNLRFLKTLQVGEPSGYVLVGNTDKAIRTLILERFTWPLFKSIGATKADWRNSKIVLEKICGESLYESVVQKLKCTPDQAKQAVDDFVDRANTLLETGDIDADILAQIAIHHDGLRELCEKAVSEKWHDSHAAEIAKAEAEVSEMEDTISIAKKQYSELLGEIATKQGERDQLLAEIEKYESIGKETQVAVRQKIADAQKDIAGFIADISVVLPQSNATLPSGNHTALLKDILRPYRSRFAKTRCKHTDTANVNLGYDFVTDMLVLEFALDRQQIDINPMRNSWLNRAGQSLAEALRLAVCQELDIEFTELVTGYRVRQNRAGDFVDIYLYDSLSSGAGYAVSIESSIRQLLTKTRELLDGCTCDSACHRCLKHYRNQHIHNVLDRKAALDLLNWGETGTRASAISCENQRHLLKSLKQILQLSGVRIDVSYETVWAEGCYGKKKVIVYPAMWKKPVEENTIFVSDVYLKYAKPYALKTIVDSL